MAIEINLSGKIALVTGATGQLGREMVTTFAKCGADVAIHYNQNEAQAQLLCEQLAQMGVQGYAVQGNVDNFESVMDMKARICEQLGAPNIVVTNAVSQVFPWKTILEEELEDYADQFRTCVMQNVHMAKAFIPPMTKKNWGRFIGINTEVSIQTLETQSAYAAGKKGMDGVLRVLAREVGPNAITVNQVAPGWTISYKDRQNGTEIQDAYSSNVPLRRRGEDTEIANVVAFLASDLASFVTGAFIPVNGGNTFVGV